MERLQLQGSSPGCQEPRGGEKEATCTFCLTVAARGLPLAEWDIKPEVGHVTQEVLWL